MTWDAMYRQYRPLLLWHALRILGPGHDLEDVVHDAIVVLLRKPEGYKISKGLLVTVVKGTAMNAARKAGQTFQPYTEVKKPTTRCFPVQIFGTRLAS